MTTDRDAELSALLDGALDARAESALRDEIARVPELAGRLQELAQVDAALRALPARPVPSNLRARLQAKLDADAHASSARAPLSARRSGAPARPSRRAWVAGLGAAAAAAAAALVVVVGEPPGNSGDLAAKPPTAIAPTPVGEPRTTAVAETRGAGTAESGDVGSPKISEQVASAEPASAPTALSEPSPEPEPNETAEPALAVDASRVAVTEPPPTSGALQRAEPSPASTGLVADPATEQLALASPPLFVEVTDDEADALGELELHDATVVGVLDLLGELDSLQAEAS